MDYASARVGVWEHCLLGAALGRGDGLRECGVWPHTLVTSETEGERGEEEKKDRHQLSVAAQYFLIHIYK